MITFLECMNETNGACNDLDKKPFQQTSGDNSMHHIAKFLSNLGFPCVITFSGLRGVRIMQQIVPFRQSTVDIHFSANMVVMTTENVARLCLKEPSISPVRWHDRSVEIDGRVISAVKTQGTCSRLCSNLSHGTNTLCKPQWHVKLRKLSHCFGRCYIQFACRTVACQFSFELLLSLLLICGRCWCSIVVSSTGAGHFVLTGSLPHMSNVHKQIPIIKKPSPMEASTSGSIGKNRHLSKKPYDLYH